LDYVIQGQHVEDHVWGLTLGSYYLLAEATPPFDIVTYQPLAVTSSMSYSCSSGCLDSLQITAGRINREAREVEEAVEEARRSWEEAKQFHTQADNAAENARSIF
jgi:hypothetical protein